MNWVRRLRALAVVNAGCALVGGIGAIALQAAGKGQAAAAAGVLAGALAVRALLDALRLQRGVGRGAVSHQPASTVKIVTMAGMAAVALTANGAWWWFGAGTRRRVAWHGQGRCWLSS